ncbi:ABC transporter ATP-binding protein [Methyloversatilis thermotolerans]|uniref:ABC transporter ATP-binding protein n=1 Tax=Methyloversatilis thermotolerans TaxID=1346290 RepID=UPI00039FC946|nr:ATP-binding cassette domain-containing protein [Methyloversatilis thermotolerans]
MSPRCVVRGLTVRVGPHALLDDIDLRLEPGRALAVLGASGAGKSLLLRSVLGQVPDGLRASGEVEIDGQVFAADDVEGRARLWGRRIAWLPQEPGLALDPTMRIGSQIAEAPHYLQHLPWRAAREQSARLLARFGLGDVTRHFAHELSGGMAQRAAYAAALSADAPLLLVDEPTKGLDGVIRSAVVEQFRTALEAGLALLVVTHDVDLALELDCDVRILQGGRCVETGPARQVFARPAHEATRTLLESQTSRWPEHVPPTPGQPLLEALDISKSFDGRAVLQSVSLTVRAGERVALMGPSGAGKTTLGNILLGLLAPDAGQIKRRSGLSPVAFQKLHQEPASAFAPGRRLGAALDDVLRLRGRNRQVLDHLLDELELERDLLQRLPHQVSGGQLQRIALVRVLLVEPALLVADEPSSRLDPLMQRTAMELLFRISGERGMALVLVTHDEHIARSAGATVLNLEPRG